MDRTLLFQTKNQTCLIAKMCINKRENALDHGQETINKVERCRRLRRFQQTLLEEDPTNRSEDMSNESL